VFERQRTAAGPWTPNGPLDQPRLAKSAWRASPPPQGDLPARFSITFVPRAACRVSKTIAVGGGGRLEIGPRGGEGGVSGPPMGGQVGHQRGPPVQIRGGQITKTGSPLSPVRPPRGPVGGASSFSKERRPVDPPFWNNLAPQPWIGRPAPRWAAWPRRDPGVIIDQHSLGPLRTPGSSGHKKPHPCPVDSLKGPPSADPGPWTSRPGSPRLSPRKWGPRAGVWRENPPGSERAGNRPTYLSGASCRGEPPALPHGLDPDNPAHGSTMSGW